MGSRFKNRGPKMLVERLGRGGRPEREPTSSQETHEERRVRLRLIREGAPRRGR